NTGRFEQAGEHSAMIHANDEVVESELRQDVAHSRADLGLDHHRTRSDRVDVALIELAKSSARRTIRAPDWLNLVAFEEPWQLPAVLGDDTRERDRQIVPQGKV